MTGRDWTRVEHALPPEGKVVLTVISDEHGTRNWADLERSGDLWFFPDGLMYVYYTPTHWQEK